MSSLAGNPHFGPPVPVRGAHTQRTKAYVNGAFCRRDARFVSRTHDFGGINLSLLDDVLTENARFVLNQGRQITKTPAKKIALFTCMDTRLVEFLEPAMGIRRGDAKVIKNAGNTLLDPNGGVIRSLVVAIFALGCEEVFVVGHRDCGMAQIDDADLEQKMIERGVPREAIAALEPSLKVWLGAFHDPAANVVRVAEMIRANSLIPRSVPVHGLIFDPYTGEIELLSSGYAEPVR